MDPTQHHRLGCWRGASTARVGVDKNSSSSSPARPVRVRDFCRAGRRGSGSPPPPPHAVSTPLPVISFKYPYSHLLHGPRPASGRPVRAATAPREVTPRTVSSHRSGQLGRVGCPLAHASPSPLPPTPWASALAGLRVASNPSPAPSPSVLHPSSTPKRSAPALLEPGTLKCPCPQPADPPLTRQSARGLGWWGSAVG